VPERPLPEETGIETLDPSLEVVDDSPVARRTASARLRRKPARAPGHWRLLIGIAAAVVALGLCAWFVIERGNSGPGAPAAAGEAARSAPQAEGGEPAAPSSPTERVAAQREALAPGDLEGRLTLAAYCREHGLDDQRRLLLREVLLLDADNELARQTFGFRKYDGPALRFQGLWLDAEEVRIAEAAEPEKADEEH